MSQTGQLYPQEGLPDGEGPMFQFTRDGMTLVLKLNGLSQHEVEAFNRPETMDLSLFIQKKVVFVVVRLPGVIDWSDAPYSVASFQRELWPQSKNAPTLTLVLVEGTDHKVKASRTVALSSEFATKLLDEVELQKKEPYDVAKYLKTAAAVQKKFAPNIMAEAGIARAVV